MSNDAVNDVLSGGLGGRRALGLDGSGRAPDDAAAPADMRASGAPGLVEDPSGLLARADRLLLERERVGLSPDAWPHSVGTLLDMIDALLSALSDGSPRDIDAERRRRAVEARFSGPRSIAGGFA